MLSNYLRLELSNDFIFFLQHFCIFLRHMFIFSNPPHFSPTFPILCGLERVLYSTHMYARSGCTHVPTNWPIPKGGGGGEGVGTVSSGVTPACSGAQRHEGGATAA